MKEDGTADAEELLVHLEGGLGSFDEPRSTRGPVGDDDDSLFSVLRFERGGHGAYATFGVSRHRLLVGEDSIAQEIVIAVGDPDFAVPALTVVGSHVLDSHEPVVPGERHRLAGWNVASVIEGVMAVPDPELPPFTRASPQIEFIRLLPITASEATRAREQGWETVAQRLVADGVDASDLFRASVA